MKDKKTKLNRINLIDVLSGLIIIFVLVFAYLAIFSKNEPTGKSVLLTVRVTEDANNNMATIYPEAKKGGTVYFDSSNYPVKVLSVKKIGTKTPIIDIILLGKGSVTADKAVFNDTRVLVGQKAEIHGNYFVRGLISNIVYEK